MPWYELVNRNSMFLLIFIVKGLESTFIISFNFLIFKLRRQMTALSFKIITRLNLSLARFISLNDLFYFFLSLVNESKNFFLQFKTIYIVIVVLQGKIFLLDDIYSLLLIKGIRFFIEVREFIFIKNRFYSDLLYIVRNKRIDTFVAFNHLLNVVFQIFSIRIAITQIYYQSI